MRMRTAWLLWALILALAIAVPVWRARADEGNLARCEKGLCVIKQETLIDLLHKAGAADQWPGLCGWER